jgi:hypothetical protein
MIDIFINDTASIIGYEVENVTFTKYENGYWYFEGYEEFVTFDDLEEPYQERYKFRANICSVGVNLEFLALHSYHWRSYGLLLATDYEHYARKEE